MIKGNTILLKKKNKNKPKELCYWFFEFQNILTRL